MPGAARPVWRGVARQRPLGPNSPFSPGRAPGPGGPAAYPLLSPGEAWEGGAGAGHGGCADPANLGPPAYLEYHAGLPGLGFLPLRADHGSAPGSAAPGA